MNLQWLQARCRNHIAERGKVHGLLAENGPLVIRYLQGAGPYNFGVQGLRPLAKRANEIKPGCCSAAKLSRITTGKYVMADELFVVLYSLVRKHRKRV